MPKTIKTKTSPAPRLAALGIPHYQILTGNTETIKTGVDGSEHVYLVQNNEIQFSEMALIKKVREDAEKCDYKCEEVKRGELKYIKFYIPNETRLYRDVVEIDLTGAYWEAAHKMGVISDETHARGIVTDQHSREERYTIKRARLIALGSLATVKKNYFFDGIKYEKLEDTKNKKTRKLYLNICLKIDRMIQQATQVADDNGGRILFYWVDAVFLHKLDAAPILDFFSKNGFKCKTKNIAWMVTEYCEQSEAWTAKTFNSSNHIKRYKTGGKGEPDKTYFMPADKNKIKKKDKTFLDIITEANRVKPKSPEELEKIVLELSKGQQ